MKIGIVSDIHCDALALRNALDLMGPVDRVLCAGDLVLQYRFSNEVIDMIRREGIASIYGNHDKSVLSSAGGALRASGKVHPEGLTFLRALPSCLNIDVGGRRLTVMHASSMDPANHAGGYYLPEDGDLPDETTADILIVGHTHRPVVAIVGRTLLINPGSLGQPRDPDAPDLRTFAVLDTATWQASIGSFRQPLDSW